MFRRAIDDLKASIGSTIGLTGLMVAAALTLFIAFWFAFAAGFVYLRDRYGAIEACLAGAGFFLLVTLIVAGIYAVRKRQARVRAAQRARESARAMLADPTMVAAALQVVRAMGLKKLLPLLAVGGLALGLLAGRSSHAQDQTPAE